MGEDQGSEKIKHADTKSSSDEMAFHDTRGRGLYRLQRGVQSSVVGSNRFHSPAMDPCALHRRHSAHKVVVFFSRRSGG